MEAYALTDTGRVRSMNQDYIYSSPEMVGSLPNLFMVADGMGGHKAGDFASRFAVENLVIHITKMRQKPVIAQLKSGIQAVNQALYQESLSQDALKGMGCTLVAAVVESRSLYVANVGDSRLYLIHGDFIRQVTRDHSYVEEMVAMGQMARNTDGYNSHKHIITRAMGAGMKVEPDFFEVELEKGDYILLCSDGLSNMLDNETIRQVITGKGTLKEKASRLIREANCQGGIDNIAVVLIDPLGKEADLC